MTGKEPLKLVPPPRGMNEEQLMGLRSTLDKVWDEAVSGALHAVAIQAIGPGTRLNAIAGTETVDDAALVGAIFGHAIEGFILYGGASELIEAIVRETT